MDIAVYVVPGMSCAHCEAAVTEEVSALPGVERVAIDLETQARRGARDDALDDAAIRAAIEEAGYEAA